MIVNITDQTIDKVDCEGIILYIFAEKKPPRGAVGTVDWLMNGLLSRLLKEGHITGQDKEVLLLPSQGRLAAGKILSFGLGEPEQFKMSKLQQICKQAGKTIARLHLHQLAMAIPARNNELLCTDGGKLAKAMIGGLLEGIKQGGEKSKNFRLLVTNFDELRSKDNKNTFRQQVGSFPEIQSIGF